ncbi:MAG: potassium channel family protein [Acidimicrobiales bacterium]
MRDPWQRVRLGVLIVALVVAMGTLGYSLLGLGTFDALYQTVITITTVGFQEVGPADEIDNTYRAFTLVLVILGAGAVLYTLGLVVDSLIEGSLNDELRRRRMLRGIEELEDHVIIAGWGRMGHAIAESVGRAGKEIVVVDRDPHDDASDHAVVVGEATDDDVLHSAGIDRAGTLIAALSHDADNLFLTLSARRMRSDLFIVARTSDQKNEPKFFQAGADRVVNPLEIGGSRMAALALQPSVAEFLDEVLHDETHDVAVHELHVEQGSSAAGRALADVAFDERHPLIIAIRNLDGRYHATPIPDTELAEGDVIIALGSADQLVALRSNLS